ncbi:hypothetical protein ACC718_32795 [Rhizobium ruizarguesonis]
MIAQRFDNGVFHITVQDNDVRRVIAKAEGDPDALLAAQNLLGNLEFNEQNVNAIKSLQSLDLISRNAPEVSKQFFSQNLMQSMGPEAKEQTPRLCPRPLAFPTMETSCPSSGRSRSSPSRKSTSAKRISRSFRKRTAPCPIRAKAGST